MIWCSTLIWSLYLKTRVLFDKQQKFYQISLKRKVEFKKRFNWCLKLWWLKSTHLDSLRSCWGHIREVERPGEERKNRETHSSGLLDTRVAVSPLPARKKGSAEASWRVPEKLSSLNYLLSTVQSIELPVRLPSCLAYHDSLICLLYTKALEASGLTSWVKWRWCTASDSIDYTQIKSYTWGDYPSSH